MAGELVPPSVINIEADDSSFLATIAKDTGILDKWASTVTQTQLGANSGRFTDDLATAKTELLDFAKSTYDANLGADADKFWSEIAGLKATFDAMSPLDVNVDANITAALAKIAVLKGDLASAMTGSILTDVAGGAAGKASTDSGILAAILGRTKGSKLSTLLYGGETGSFMSKLLSPATMLSQLFSAKFGSLGSLAGFGTEHLAITAGSLAGLGVAGGAGAGLLGMGNIGKDLVGGGADSLVSHEVLSNMSDLLQDTTTYGALVKKVGKDGAQAAEQLATAWSKTKSSFDKMTGPAQLEFSKLGQAILRVGDSYIPLVAAAATKNFKIIDKAIQPLLKWLEGTGPMQGKGIFAQLEKDFSGGLGTSVRALSQGFEHLMRVIDIAAGYTGKFMKAWGNKEALTSTTAGIEKTRSTIAKLIGDFRTVEAFLKILGKDLVDVFHNDAGTATAVLKELTKGLQDLGKWINSVGGSNALKDLFNVHKGETLTLVRSLGELLVSFGKAYLKIAPFMVTLATDILKVANAFFNFTQKIPGIGPIVALATALGIMELKSKTLSSAFKLLKDGFNIFKTVGGYVGDLGAFAAKLLGIGTAGTAAGAGATEAGAGMDVMAGSEDAAAASSDILNAALGIGVLGAVVALGVGIYELVKHWSAVWSTIKSVASDVWGYLKSAFSAVASFLSGKWGWLIAIFMPPIGALVALVAHWSEVWGAIKAVADDVWQFLDGIWQDIRSGVTSAWSAITSFLSKAGTDAINGLWSGIKTAWTAVSSFFTGMAGTVKGWLSDAHTWLVRIGKDILNGLFTGLTSVWDNTVVPWFHLQTKIIGFLVGAATWLVKIGKDVISGLWSGIQTGWKSVSSFFTGMAKTVVGWLSSAGTWLIAHGKDVISGLWSGITSGWKAVSSWFKSLAGTVKGWLSGAGTWLVSIGKDIVQGLINGIEGMVGKVTSVVKSIGHGIGDVLHSFGLSPWPSTISAGQDAVQGLVQGISDTTITSQITSTLTTLSTNMINTLKAQRSNWQNEGVQLTNALAAGITSNGSAITAALTAVLTQAVSTAVTKAGSQSTSQLVKSVSVGAGLVNG